MLKFEFSNSGVTTKAIWPEVTSSYAGNPSGSYLLQLTHDYDQTQYEFTGTLINNPTAFTPRLILQFNKSDVPEYSGFYTSKLYEGLAVRYKWGATHVKWTDADWIWNTALQLSGSILLDNDRAWVSGSDMPPPLEYYLSSSEAIYESGSSYPPFEYISSDENGAYTVYNG